MKLYLSIDAGNDAFVPDPRPELERILGRVPGRIDDGETTGVLLDVNGNTCGRYAYVNGESLADAMLEALVRDA